MNDLLSMALRTVLRDVIRGYVRVHGFTTPREKTGRGYRDLDLALNWGWHDDVGSVGGPLSVLWEARSRRAVQVLIDVGLLLRKIRVRAAFCQGSGHRGLRNVGRWNRSDAVDVQVHVGGGLLLLLRLVVALFLRLVVALLLEGCSDCRNDGVKLCLERLS